MDWLTLIAAAAGLAAIFFGLLSLGCDVARTRRWGDVVIAAAVIVVVVISLFAFGDRVVR